MSTSQFKHLDKTQNWYRRGELNLPQRMPQVLSIAPTFLEYQTWNDGPESHYIGNVWDFAIEGSPSHAYIDGFDHTGYQNIVKPFISAFKAGKTSVSDVMPLNGQQVVGTFWYRTILTSATCASDALGKPDGWQNAEDVVNVAVILAAGAAGATVNVYSGGTRIGSGAGKAGLNSWEFKGMKTGEVKVEVLAAGSGNTMVSKTGGKQVAADAAVCNYNYFVVGL
jgi:glucan endo-1,3-alpha-glucosidase